MSDAKAEATVEPPHSPSTASAVPLARIFVQFLIIGATSFGGPVPYLRDRLVVKNRWLDDKQFVEQLSISQSLPGLNATNMSMLVGDRLGGARGAMLAILGMCLPGGALMFAVGLVYRAYGDHVWATAALKGVAAASVGLVLSTVVQLMKRSLNGRFDVIFVALTVLAVNVFHFSVPTALIGVGLLAILWHRPGPSAASNGRLADADGATALNQAP
jgi:chromate transporter